jgi:hypothetical protein
MTPKRNWAEMFGMFWSFSVLGSKMFVGKTAAARYRCALHSAGATGECLIHSPASNLIRRFDGPI